VFAIAMVFIVGVLVGWSVAPPRESPIIFPSYPRNGDPKPAKAALD
jgi:hypothetical protein